MNNESTKLATAEPEKPTAPLIVDAEKMFDRLAEITRQTTAKAYEFFMAHGSQFGSHLEDWLRAESEVLRAAPVEIKETKNLVKVKVAVPGFKADEIEVSLNGDTLIVSGETQITDEKEDESTFYSEWRSDRFLRQLTLPCEAEADKVDAKLKDGILTLSLQKKAEEEAVKVAVKAA